MARILDSGGTLLAEATLHVSDDEQIVVLSQLTGKGALMKYYFASAGRAVVVEAEGRRAAGKLATRWQGSGRLWLVALESAGALLPEREPATPTTA